MWDTEVDIACIGAGLGGLANAIAATDAGGEVLVFDAAPSHFGSLHGTVRERVRAKGGWLVHATLDAETDEYFAAFTEGVADLTDAEAGVPVRVARNLTREEAHGRFIEPFVGSRLTGWASQCLSSPCGLMYTSMRNWPTTTMRSADGQSIEAFSIGTVEWNDGHGEQALRRWMFDRARERDIDVQTGTLQRLVFEDGLVVGVVLTTPEGPYAVRTRAGVTIAPGDEDSPPDASQQPSGEPLHVCIVGRTASRFGRVELMNTEPAAAPRPTCTGSRRQFREGLHDSRQPALEVWRCGKPQGYSSLGQ